jgi:hypothetical protein
MKRILTKNGVGTSSSPSPGLSQGDEDIATPEPFSIVANRRGSPRGFTS